MYLPCISKTFQRFFQQYHDDNSYGTLPQPLSLSQRFDQFFTVLRIIYKLYVTYVNYFLYTVLDIFICTPTSYLVRFLHIIYCSMYDMLVK